MKDVENISVRKRPSPLGSRKPPIDRRYKSNYLRNALKFKHCTKTLDKLVQQVVNLNLVRKGSSPGPLSLVSSFTTSIPNINSSILLTNSVQVAVSHARPGGKVPLRVIALYPNAETRDPKPEIRSPQLEPRNPKPEFRNTKPETRDTKPDTRHPKPVT